MSRRDLIDPESREPLDQLLEAMPGGFNAIPDIARRAAVIQMLAAIEVPPNPNVKHRGVEVEPGRRQARGTSCGLPGSGSADWPSTGTSYSEM